MPIKINDSLELSPPNIFDLEKQLRAATRARNQILSSAIASMVQDSRNSAEFDTFYRFADSLRRVTKKHSWTRATIASVARATVGAGFKFVSHPVFGRNRQISQEEMDRILEPVYNFFYGIKNSANYLQDIIPLSSKLYYTIASLVAYGQAAWEIIYDKETGNPISFDAFPYNLSWSC